LLLGYEFLAFTVNQKSVYQIRNTADVMFKILINSFGIHGPFAFGLLILLILLVVLYFHPFKKIPVRMHYLFLMIIESSVLAVLTALVLSKTAPHIRFSLTEANSPLVQIMLSLGAGVYEELFFRALLFWGTSQFMLRVLKMEVLDSIVHPALISSLIFAIMHFLGAESFTMFGFVYRFLAGLFFCLLFFLRGLGVAAWTHAIYDLFVFL
jgi:membrane protease YdiL (CAAX protease family)